MTGHPIRLDPALQAGLTPKAPDPALALAPTLGLGLGLAPVPIRDRRPQRA